MASATEISPFAPDRFPELEPVAGLRLAAGSANLKYRGRDDVFIAEFIEGTRVAGVFTKSATASAPVEWCRHALPGGRARALIVNSGNANAFTGKKGDLAVKATVAAVADILDCRPSRVFVSSTGVIGEFLPVEKLTDAIPRLVENLDPGNFEPAARAFMTTDTYPKGAAAVAGMDGAPVAISGFAKGSGMIEPNMATMLAYVFTDAAIPSPILQELLDQVVDKSFNAITVDGDTSTSDTVMLFATGAGGCRRSPDSADDPALDDFKLKLEEVMVDLATQIVKDGEGASKFITIDVSGAGTDVSAKVVAKAIANSPLVKTAIAGGDANWGRIVMAAGKSGEPLDRSKLSVTIGGVSVAGGGLAVPGYDETPVAEHLKGRYVDIAVDLGVGGGLARVWTCDLTHGYISINADYRS